MSDEPAGIDAAFAEAAERLYAVPVGEFMATRTELVAAARAAKDRPLAARIGTLRKPSVAAGVLNQLVRAHPQVVEQVRSVGAQLRAAQANLHGTAISALRPARDAVIADVLEAADAVARAADAALTATAREEIRDTVIAALASAEATEALASGALTRTLAYSGFGEIDLDDAVVEGFRRPAPKLVLLRPEAASADPAADVEAAEAEPPPEPPATREPPPEPPATQEPESDPLAALAAGLTPASAPGGAEEDVEALIEAAAQAYADAAGRVAQTKSVVAQTSRELDAAKARADDLRAQLAATEAELAELFARDAQAREAVTVAVHARQAAAELLARREAQA